MVRVVLTRVIGTEDDRIRTTTLSPGEIAHASDIKGPLLILYSPPVIDRAVCPAISVGVTGFDTYHSQRLASIIPEKLNAFGTTRAEKANAKRESLGDKNVQSPTEVMIHIHSSV